MRRALSGCSGVAVFLAGTLAHTVKPLVLYDDFDAAQIAQDKWVRAEEGAGTEAILQIQDNRLRLFNRGYGKTDSDQGRDEGSLVLTFSNAAAVTAIQATVQVNDVGVTGRPSNPAPTYAVTCLGGSFFNTATPTPDSEWHDVWAVIGLVRGSDMRVPTDVLRLMYYGNYQGWRYSPLQQINTTNVKRLVVTWKFRTGLGAENFQVTPLVVDGVMYLTNQKNELFALNAETGTMLWRSTYFQIEFSPRGRTWGHAQHRGVAVARGKVLLATEDAHFVALDAKSGEVLWKTRAGDYEEGHGFTSPPLIVKDKAILGIVTGEKPTRGFIDAYDIETGKRLWRFYTVPGPGEPGHETWGDDSWRYGCGPAWLPGIYDAALNLVYLGIGNPCPMFSGEERAGDNLYTNAIVALTPETGQLHWYVQVIPHDLWDNDATNELVLVDLAVHDKSVKALAFDAANGELVWSFRTGSGLRGSPISYAVGGKQYISVPSGWGGVAARNFSYAFPALAHAPRGSTLFVFGLCEE